VVYVLEEAYVSLPSWYLFVCCVIAKKVHLSLFIVIVDGAQKIEVFELYSMYLTTKIMKYNAYANILMIVL